MEHGSRPFNTHNKFVDQFIISDHNKYHNTASDDMKALYFSLLQPIIDFVGGLFSFGQAAKNQTELQELVFRLQSKYLRAQCSLYY